jgi:hypothetical protein
VSARQAKRYLADARTPASPDPPPPTKAPLSFTIAASLLNELRRAARRHRRSISAEVEVALQRYLASDAAR